jgi:acetyltransferase-like isoleucine patch superfamily enzyme
VFAVLVQPVRRLVARVRGRGRVSLGAGVRLGRGVRLDAAPGARIVVGDGCRLEEACRLHAIGGEIRLGARARLGERCVLVALSGVEVGDGCRLADGVLLVDSDPAYADPERPVRLQGLRTAPVRVGADVVLDRAACVLRGVSVGQGARVGAHTVVTRDVPAGVVVEGTPAG